MKGRFPDRAVKPLLVLGGVTVAIITGDIPLFLGIVVGVLAATGIPIAVLHRTARIRRERAAARMIAGTDSPRRHG